VDNQDHVFIVNRNNITAKEAEVSRQAPPFIEFDSDGKVVNGFGDWETAPNTTHGCIVDHENNFWTAGNGDGIIQKYSHDGKLMMQIGKRGVVDTSDGTLRGRPMNSSHTQFYMPSDIAVDPKNGDVFVADGYGNSRIAVFNRKGEFLRQWGHQGTKEEADAGVGGAFMQVVHCVALGNDELVYVCDRQGDRIQVFDKLGNFKKISGLKEDAAFPIVGEPLGGWDFLRTANSGTCMWPMVAMNRSRFSIVPVAKFSQASVAPAIRSANLPMPTHWPSIPKATFTWLRPTGAEGYRGLSR
jgi:hypothetical protein